MWNEFCGPAKMIEVRVVESCGMAVALPECDVIGVLPLADCPENTIAHFNGVSAMHMDDRFRPLISLKQALCVETPTDHPRREDQVVVLRLNGQLFGLLVEQVREPEQAMVLPTVTPARTLAVFRHLLQMADGGILFALNTVWLALSIEAPQTQPALRLAA
jgi:chemotaxis protein histidine kinase CheA